jgi:glutamate-1-semialdehyde 2,1-aminomutase
MELSESFRLKAIGSKLLPSLSQTFSKSPTSFVEGVYPVYAKRGDGCYLFDVDDNKYIDYLMSLGPIVLGHNYPSVNNAIKEQLKNGIIFSLPHFKEIEAAESLQKIIPCADMTRFTKSGSDAVTGAVRAARAITGNDMIFYCGSGGVWDDWFSIVTTRNKGIPNFNRDLIKIFEYNNIKKLEELFEKYKNKVAAIVMEPAVFSEPKDGFLKKVKKLAAENNCLLIFDEILTGFRLSKGGGQELFGVTPDIATLGKGIANGMPLGAIVGKSEYMKIFDEVFVSTTYGGEALSLAACVATINEFEKNDICGHMSNQGNKIKKQFNNIADEHNIDAICYGFPSRLAFEIKDKQGQDSMLLKSLFLQNLIENGIFVNPGVFLFSFSHSDEDITYTEKQIEIAFQKLRSSIDNDSVKTDLKGKVAKSVMSIRK